ncbi:uncharacterized protein LOC143378386 [Andrena cerasifolii]|uniref:uncharacterized protein LOC143378386 n=1 Tax=Andrena cerasifolii TaxID=2819439 RepID=UPI0040381A4E
MVAIPRKNRTSSKYSAVCSLHFAETDIQRYHGILSPNGVLENVLLRCPRLIENAVPSISPNLPYFTKRVLPSRKDPVKREQEILQRHENLVQELTNSDLISNFADLINNYKEKLVISNCWTIKITNSKFYFLMLVCNDDSDFLVLNTQIVISDDMKLQVFQEGNELSFNDLKWVTTY